MFVNNLVLKDVLSATLAANLADTSFRVSASIQPLTMRAISSVNAKQSHWSPLEFFIYLLFMIGRIHYFDERDVYLLTK